MQGEGCSEPSLPLPQDRVSPSPFWLTIEPKGLPARCDDNDDVVVGESASRCNINKKGVATNNQASSFSGGPQEPSHRACPQELLPNYQLGPGGRRGASQLTPPHLEPPSLLRPPLTYTSAFATCLGAGLFPAQTWRVFSFLLRCASSLQPQLQSLLLRRGILLLPPLPAIPASELARVFGAARRAGHGSRGLCLHLGKRKDPAGSRTQRPVGGRAGF